MKLSPPSGDTTRLLDAALYKWLESVDIVIVRGSDRAPLAVLPIETVVELVRAAERHTA